MALYVYRGGRVQALDVPDSIEFQTEVDLKKSTDDYIKFGTDNLFPQALIELMRNSSVHRGVINNKRIYATGRGFATDDLKIATWIDSVNADGEMLRDVYSKLQLDHISFGNAFLEVVTDSKNSFVNIYHKDASMFRISKDKTEAIWHPDWAEYRQTKRYAKRFTLYPKFQKQPDSRFLHSMLHIKIYEPGSAIYGIPSYISGLNSAGIIYKTDKWNLSRLDNSFKPSGILIVDAEMSDGDSQNFEAKFDEKFTGEGNTGKIMKVVKEMTGDNTRFISFNDQYEGDWTQLHTQSEGNIITAHNWFRSLSGIADNTGFDTQRIRLEYDMALKTVILDQQEAVLEPIRKVMWQMTGMDMTQVEIINRPPVSVSTLIDVNKVVRIWEGRKMLGLDYDEDDVTQQTYIDNGKQVANNTAGDN